MCLSEGAANRIAHRLAESFWVPVGEANYVQAPSATRGVPHGLIPGVHSALVDYVDALEGVRALGDRADSPTTEGLFCLPLSPWTQARSVPAPAPSHGLAGKKLDHTKRRAQEC